MRFFGALLLANAIKTTDQLVPVNEKADDELAEMEYYNRRGGCGGFGKNEYA